MKANKFQVSWNGRSYSLEECFAKYDGNVYRNADGTIDLDPRHPDDGKYGGASLTGQCKQWVDAAEQCQSYLIGYYKDKLEDSNISESNKQYYKCLLEKVQTGNIDFPISNMEASCKS